MKLLRTIQLDTSDTFVFDRPAEPGEWVVSGSFVFAHQDVSALQGKARVAFRSGFLGVQSLGWSTLAQIVEASEQDHDAAVRTLAAQFVEKFGAPNAAEAEAAAREEFAFASSLCSHPTDTLIAVHRTQEDGEIRETFRSLRPKEGPKPLRAFAFLEAQDDDERPEDRIDIAALGRDKNGNR